MAEKIITETKTLLSDLCFGEGPRWHEGRLWFSDMHDHKVLAVDPGGNTEVIAQVPTRPSGLGWLPDGSLLIVSMTDQRLLVVRDGQLSTFADLSDLASFHCNDMVTDELGRSWVGNFGYDLMNGAEQAPAELILVDPEGRTRVVAADMAFPNGAVITPDGNTLIVGETMAARLTAFDIQSDGSLQNRRIWAQMEGAVPDGICLDAEGGIWVASPISNEVLRVLEGGEVTHRVKVESQAFACMLGGPDGKTLFILTAGSSQPEACIRNRDGKVETAEVEVAAAGWP